MKTIFNTIIKNMIYKLIIISSLSFSAISAAEDFSTIPDDKFFDMREQVRTMDDDSRNTYRTERQGRMMTMDQSERDSRFADMGASGRKNMENRGQRNGQKNGQRKRDGSGGGQQRGKGQGGQSGHSDSSSQYRYGQSSETSGGGRRGGGGRYGSGR